MGNRLTYTTVAQGEVVALHGRPLAPQRGALPAKRRASAVHLIAFVVVGCVVG